MSLFLSTYHNKIDKKGRISVPASFRGVLQLQNFQGIIVYSSFVNPCIEACGMDRLEMLARRIETLDPFSDEHDAFSTTILGGSVQLPFDGEGRVVLPEKLMKQAGLSDQAVFVGKGKTFEIWEPDQFASYADRLRETAREKRLSLRAENRGDA